MIFIRFTNQRYGEYDDSCFNNNNINDKVTSKLDCDCELSHACGGIAATTRQLSLGANNHSTHNGCDRDGRVIAVGVKLQSEHDFGNNNNARCPLLVEDEDESNQD